MMSKMSCQSSDSRDKILFRQPASTHLGDCPICFLPLPIDPLKSSLQVCCSTLICKGCCRSNELREVKNKLFHLCPMCRQHIPISDKEIKVNIMKRVAANDPVAIQESGKIFYHEGKSKDAFKCWTKAAELGNVDSLYLLSLLYRDGRGVEKNEDMEWHMLEEAAIAGHVGARFTLAHHENSRRGNLERAIKHFIIAASNGCVSSMRTLEQCYADGKVNKDMLNATKDAHQIAADSMTSSQRKEQANYEKEVEEYFCAGS